MLDIDQVIDRIVAMSAAAPPDGVLLVAVSGIDGSGKSASARQIADRPNSRNARTALINLDVWHTPPETRFGDHRPAERFYEHAFRFHGLFGLIVDPLRSSRSVYVQWSTTVRQHGLA